MGTCSSSLLMEHSVPFKVYKTDKETEREKETKNINKKWRERMSSQVTQENIFIQIFPTLYLNFK